MKMKLTKKELYIIEKVMDNYRDDFLKGINQAIGNSKNTKEYKEFIDKRFKVWVESFDKINTICAKLERLRLE